MSCDYAFYSTTPRTSSTHASDFAGGWLQQQWKKREAVLSKALGLLKQLAKGPGPSSLSALQGNGKGGGGQTGGQLGANFFYLTPHRQQ